jgi:hypothetical protein
MANDNTRGFFDRTIQIKVWHMVAAVIIAPLFVFWMMVVHQEDEIVALSRNEVVTDAAGNRIWYGAFYNTDDMVYRDVATTVNFLDANGEVVARATNEAAELPPGQELALQATLPPEAVNLRIYSVQWRNDRTSAMMGPFREPWEFGYLMVDPKQAN